MLKYIYTIMFILILVGCGKGNRELPSEQNIRRIFETNFKTTMAIKLPELDYAYIVLRDNQIPLALIFEKPSIIGTPEAQLRMKYVEFNHCNTVVSDAIDQMLNQKFGHYTPCKMDDVDGLLVWLKTGDIRWVDVSTTLKESHAYSQVNPEEFKKNILLYRPIKMPPPISVIKE